ncbi:MAG: RHS repeat-associated core domain-containing protein, partial [Candidatus Electrothrix sp. AUS1_2]|nr:RHS repeat-associated core domain-containing protein [Candidatus Electrothrix sp. AUS1_2]
DPENRLTLAQDYQIVGESKKEAAHRIDRAFTTLEYGGGRRLVQHYDPKQGGNGVDKRDEYVFDGLDPVAEYDMLNGQRTDYYRGAGNHLALMHQYKGGTQGQMYWYHYNNKGDVVGLTKQNGNSHHNYRYDPYGAVLPENGNFTDPHNHYTLTGKEFDENTGLVWFGARHYEPETGVWMGQDSYRGRLDSPMSLHRYGYVNNNPLNYYDPTGNFAIAVVALPSLAGLAEAALTGIAYAGAVTLGYLAGDYVAEKIDEEVIEKTERRSSPPPDDGCDEEWANAYIQCEIYLNSQDSMCRKGMTGGYNNLADCARGLVSERCGGNPVQH